MKSNYYSFEKIISKNLFCESWLAVDKESGENVFVKIPLSTSERADVRIEEILYNSFQNQKVIGNGRIVTARRKTKESKRLQIEYPYLSEEIYIPLSSEKFWSNLESILPQMAVLLDYLHLYGLVHCDIKLNNFLVKSTANGPQLYLNDLDFLTKDKSIPRGMIFGTRDHIPPEIDSNEIVLCSSDNYSIGAMLKKCLSELNRELDKSVPEQTQFSINELANLLSNKDPYNRPRILMDALVDASIIDEESRSNYNRAVIAMKLLSSFKFFLRNGDSNTNELMQHFFDKNNIMGISDELKNDFQLSLNSNRSATIRVFKKFFKIASIARHGDYWHFECKDSDMYSILVELDKIKNTNVLQFQDSCDLRELQYIIKIVDNSIVDGNYEKAYHLSIHLLGAFENQNLSKSASLYENILIKLVSLSRDLNRNGELRKFLLKLYTLRKRHGNRDINLLYEYNTQLLLISFFIRAKRIIKIGKLISEKRSDQISLSKFLVQEAWVKIHEEHYEEARIVLNNCQTMVNRIDDRTLLIGIYYSLGILDWRRGKIESSTDNLLRAFNIAEEEDHLSKSESVSLLTGLIMLLINQMEINKAIEIGKSAVLEISETRDKSKLSRIYILMATAYSLIPNEAKARYWIQKAYPYLRVRYNRPLIIYYYLILGMIEIDSFHLNKAKIILCNALELAAPKENDVNTCAIYQQLAKISFYEGKKLDFEKYLQHARQISKSIKDKVSYFEIESMSALFDFYYSQEACLENVELSFIKLVSNSAHNYSSILLFHILLNSTSKNDRELIEKMSNKKVTISLNSNIRLFKMISLVQKSNEKDISRIDLKLNFLKEAYKVSNESGNRFNSLLLSQKIAQLYLKKGETRQARKYLENAKKIAGFIGNSFFLDKIEKNIEEIKLTNRAVGQELEGYKRIGKILGDIDNYDKSIKEVIKFAVSATGAERGVLFLKNMHEDKLRMEAYVNCDEESIEDIIDFSTNLPNSVLINNETLTIEDATKDKRTRDYKSIIQNNILSVQCTPIYYDEGLLGVIYLDNHTIPALFEEKDLEYIKSMSNIIAIMIMVLRGQKDLKYINKQLSEDYNKAKGSIGFISENKIVLDMFKMISKFAKTNVPILIIGESGTGKEIISNMIHELSDRKGKPFLKLNCAALPANLIESELFGVAKKVATGVDAREGKFKAADGGTLLLDEIGDMPMEIQAKVLRVLEYQEFQPVGSNITVYTDVRFIYATNKDLKELIRLGKFREDLYSRIHSIDIKIPPLRERVDDILLLLDKYIKFYSNIKPAPRFSNDAIECLMNYHWPSNVRELKNFVERCCILYPGDEISKGMLPEEFQSQEINDRDLNKKIISSEISKYRLALNRFAGNESKSAKYLNIPLSTFRRRLKKYNLDKK